MSLLHRTGVYQKTDHWHSFALVLVSVMFPNEFSLIGP
jgi:hypothetical protein